MEVTSTGKMSRVVITAVLFLTTALYANGQFSVTIVTNPSGPYMAVLCLMPANATNGTLDCPLGGDGVLSYEDTCTVSCDMGYMVTGDAVRICQSDGTFNGTEANCSRIPCIMPTDPMNGMINCLLGDDGVLSYEDTCTLTCAMGYMVNSAAMRTCQSDGTFSGTEANCSRIPPAFTAHPMNISVMLESEPIDVTLTCAADRATSYNWERDGDTISPNATGVNTNMLTINNLQLTDAGNYRCVATNEGGSVMSYYGSLTITVPPPTVTTSPSGGAMVGSPLTIQCRVSTVSGVDLNSVMISWMGPGGNAIVLDTRVTIIPTTSSGTDFMSTLNFMYLMEGDEDMYTCNVMILETSGSASVVLETLMIPTPSVMVTAPDNQTVGDPLTLTCDVTAVRGITSRVDIVWSRDGMVVMRTNNISSTMMDTSLVYTDTYNISRLNTTDDGIEYECRVVINSTSQVMANNTVSLDVTVPTPSVTVSAPNTQIVGQPLTLECSVTIVRGITSRVDIIWSSDGRELNRTNDTSSAMMDSSLIYTDTYTISQVNTTDDGRVYECTVVINASPVVMADGSATLDVMVPTPDVTLSPPGPIQGAMLGNPQMIQCTVSTVSGVESSSVMISWMGPGGNVTNNSRVTINPTTVNDSDFISILYFMYLMEGDEGNYTCSVTILETNEEQSVMLGMLTVPTPDVIVTAPNTQIVGQSLTLECSVTAVSGITSRVDIVWRRNGGTELQMTGVNISSTTDNSVVYTDNYTIMEVSTDDDGREYQCEVVINTTQPVMATNSVTLDVMVPQPEVTITQSMEGPASGQEPSLICDVTVVNGISPDLVMINWTVGDNPLSSPQRVSISDQTTREPPLMANLTPPMIFGNASYPIELTCTASVGFTITSAVYNFIWWRNGQMIDLTDDRIMITNDIMSSVFNISGNDTDGILDNGVYNCQVNLTIAGNDTFSDVSDDSSVVLKAMVSPYTPVLGEVITAPYSVVIFWSIPSIVFGQENYTVQYGTDTVLLSTSNVVLGNDDTNALNDLFSINITGLTPFTTYYYVITATNSVGNTSTSVMNFTTNETAPNSAPMNFRSFMIATTSVTFLWTALPVSEANGMIRQYNITCKGTLSTIVTGTATMGTVTGLSPFTFYSCTIFAVTVANGPISDPYEVTTAQAAPDPPVITAVTGISNSTVRVMWTRPAVLNGILATYTIVYNSNDPVTVNYNGQPMQFYDITGLDPYEMANVTLLATTGGGTSVPSLRESGRTSQAAPGIVVHTISSVSNTAVNVMWNPPVTPNGVITGYEVIYSMYEDSSLSMSGMLGDNDRSFHIENLAPGTPYQAMVVAYTTAGRGAENNFEPFFSQELAANNTPQNVDFERLSSTSLRVTWTPLTLFQARGFPFYIVTLILPSSNNHGKRQSDPPMQNTTDSFAVVTGLLNGRTYTTTVGVQTATASGMPTEIQNADPISVSTIVNVTDGNITNGNITNGNITDGNITNGNITDGNITDGNITNGNITDGNITNGNSDLSDGVIGGIISSVLAVVLLLVLLSVYIGIRCYQKSYKKRNQTAEYDKEMFEIQPLISNNSMRKETPPDNISDTSIGMSDNAENDYSDWRRETPLEVLGTTATAIGNEELQRISEKTKC